MQHIITESPIISEPKNVKAIKDKIRFEAVLQTANEINRNHRYYDKRTLEESIKTVLPRVQNKEFIGELDHPSDATPNRQCTVELKNASHLIKELWFDGNLLKAIVETLTTPYGNTLAALIRDGVNLGFSYRGMGELQSVTEGMNQYYKVLGPLQTITYDAVSTPSHAKARIQKIEESVAKSIYESINLNSIIREENGLVICENGICFLPNAFDQQVEMYKKRMLNKFSK